jgi:hypothetical protein
MNLGQSSKTLINAAKTRMLNFPFKFRNNTSIPIILTENDSIINTVNIDEDIVNDNNRAIAFLSDLKK